MNEKKSFVLYCDYREHIKLLSVEDKAALLDAIFAYASGEDVELEGAVGMAFSFITSQMERDAVKWEKKREKLRQNGAKGGLAKARNAKQKVAKGSNAKQGLANVAVNVNDNVTVNDNVNVINNTLVKIDYQNIINLYNTICVSLPKVTKLSDSRKRAIKARLKSYSVNDLKKAFELAESSDFLSGRNGSWNASFDWLMNDNNIAKVLDGNYKNKTGKIEIDDRFRKAMRESEVVDFGI
jgi:hypothetical protein